MKKICILYSGGLDSHVMLQMAKVEYPASEITLCFYDIGQEYVEKERAALPEGVKIRSIDWIKSATDVVSKENTQAIMIPGRNMALAVLVACQELPDEIWMGALMGEIHDEATDKNLTFIEKVNDTIKYVLSPYYTDGRFPKARFPLVDAGFGKLEALQWYLNNGGTSEEIVATSSCLSAETSVDSKACGQCIVCMRRWGIFTQLGIKESYIKHPVTEMSDQNRKMVHEMMKGERGEECHYDEYRRREIIPALRLVGVV